MAAKPVLLDTFCKAGGAGYGYAQAGFEVVGVDIESQPNYPFKFIQADALDYIACHGIEYDAIHASPPCQAYSVTKYCTKVKDHPELIGPVRELLKTTDLPYIIENVVGARESMVAPVQLCGSSFGLRVRRHRLFESNKTLTGKNCAHQWQQNSKCFTVRVGASSGGKRYSGTVPVFGGLQLLFEDGKQSTERETTVCREAMGIPWMNKKELNQAIPPAYTKWLGEQLIRGLD